MLAVAAQFVPFFLPESSRAAAHALAGVAAFFLGMSQDAFGNYLSELWTDRRRERETLAAENVAERKKHERFRPFMQALRNTLAGREEQFANNYDVLMLGGNLVIGGTPFRFQADSEFPQFQSMIDRLEKTRDLTVTKRDSLCIRFRLEDDFYAEILELQPENAG